VFPVTGYLNRTRLCWPFLIAALFESGRIVLKHPARGVLELPCVTEKEKVAAIARIASSGCTQEEIECGVIDLCERSERDATELLNRAIGLWPH
jgi:hypothetical protein